MFFIRNNSHDYRGRSQFANVGLLIRRESVLREFAIRAMCR
jgi:hypothetical protein